jgi:cold shock protein
MNGKIKKYNTEKAYGFIVSDSGDEYFFHISGVSEGFMPAEGARVSFEVGEGKKGQIAVNVTKSN